VLYSLNKEAPPGHAFPLLMLGVAWKLSLQSCRCQLSWTGLIYRRIYFI